MTGFKLSNRVTGLFMKAFADYTVSKEAKVKKRSCLFRTIGYGHNKSVWREIFSELKKCGFGGVIFIEHKDDLMTGRYFIYFLKSQPIFPR
nr:hypothetical protein [uncultured Blautia sp.]